MWTPSWESDKIPSTAHGSSKTYDRSTSTPSTLAAKQPCFFPRASVMTSAQVMPAAYSLTLPSGRVMLIMGISEPPATPTGLNLRYQCRARWSATSPCSHHSTSKSSPNPVVGSERTVTVVFDEEGSSVDLVLSVPLPGGVFTVKDVRSSTASIT